MDILRAIMEGAEGPTQIMYKANLSWILLCDHLSALGDQGFVGEKTVGNRIRQQRDSKNPGAKNFLSAFYKGRAHERSKRQA